MSERPAPHSRLDSVCLHVRTQVLKDFMGLHPQHLSSELQTGTFDLL